MCSPGRPGMCANKCVRRHTHESSEQWKCLKRSTDSGYQAIYCTTIILFCLQVDEPEPEKKVVIRQASRQCGVPLQPAVQKKLPTRFEEFSFQARDERKKQQLVEKLRRTEEEKLKEVCDNLSHHFE